MKLMPNWMTKTALVAVAMCVASSVSADIILQDDFNNGEPFNTSTDDPAGPVVPHYWQRYASSAMLESRPTITEENGSLTIALPRATKSGGIMVNSALYGSTANPEGAGIWKYGGNTPLANDELKNTLDPRMHFLDDKTTAAMPSRYIRLKGIHSWGDSFVHERGYKVEWFANSQRRQLGDYLIFEFSADREMRIYRKNGTPNLKLITSLYLPHVPSALDIMVDETEYRVSAYYEFPVTGDYMPVRSGVTTISGDHGINKSLWIQNMLYGVSTTDVDPRGSTFGISPFARDLNTSYVSIDSITIGERAETAGNLGF